MDKIIIVPYSNEWKRLYELEKERLEVVFKEEYFGIMHIGSTSIEGLDAKPIIDISIGLKHLNNLNYYKEKLAAASYKTNSSFFDNDWVLFSKKDMDIKYHLHLMPFDNVRLLKQVVFKIYLEEHKEIAELYVKKKKNYLKYDDDIWYSQNKLPFVEEITSLAFIELVSNPQYWKVKVFGIMGYLPYESLFK